TIVLVYEGYSSQLWMMDICHVVVYKRQGREQETGTDTNHTRPLRFGTGRSRGVLSSHRIMKRGRSSIERYHSGDTTLSDTETTRDARISMRTQPNDATILMVQIEGGVNDRGTSGTYYHIEYVEQSN
ncbi:9900_t:CDS:2, partial [Acaulospora colombiana]